MIKHLLSASTLAILGFIISHFLGGTADIGLTVAITLFTAYLWISEAVPIPVASLVPFVAFPIAGILTHKEAASAIGNHVIVLLMGAFMLGKGIEKSGVHKRLALGMIDKIGGNSATRIVLAFMLATAFLSIWISNTASVLALLPVAAIVASASADRRFQLALLLGLAYSASLGGVGSLIGTPPNVIFASVYDEFSGTEYGFLAWMKVGVPIIIVAIPLMAMWLTRGISLTSEIKIDPVGKMSIHESRVLWVFGFTAFLWVFRKEPFGGWAGLLDMPYVGSSTVALLGVVLMFLVSTGKKNEKQQTERLLDWKTAESIPWGMLLLFAGGICIAKAFVSSGLSKEIGSAMSAITTLPPLVMMLVLALSVSFLTEITSNTATATLLMPILASAAQVNNIPIEWLMIPAVISCSCAFCLPVATAPNSIVFAHGDIRIKDMAREGVVLNIIVACVVSGMCWLMLV